MCSKAKLLFMIITLCYAMTLSLNSAAAQPPNIVVIFTDDQGYGDLGCYGAPDIHTPRIDQLAAEGMRFTSFYAAPFCGPSRAQLMTASYPPRVSHARHPGPGSNWGLHPNEITVAEVLKSAGYATMHIGKWHLGDAPELLPTRQGFDRYFGIPFSNDMWRYHPRMPRHENEDELMQEIRKRAAYTGFAGQGSYYEEGDGFPNDLPLMRGEKVIETNPDQRQLTTRYTEEALQFMEEHRAGPFFLYLAHSMPHVPLFVSDKHKGQSPRGLYGDVIMEIDWSTGQVLDKLKELGIDEQTLVIFTSDNGPWLPYGIDAGSAGPLRDGKGTTWEGGVRVPAIFRWPGKITAGSRTGAIAGNLDFLPTFAHLAGTAVPKDRVLDGHNLWPLLAGETDKSPYQYFHYFGGSPGGAVNYRGIRDERWKLVLNVTRDGRVTGEELYDLGGDVSEKFNRIQAHPDIAKKLESVSQRFYNELVNNIRPAGISAKRK